MRDRCKDMENTVIKVMIYRAGHKLGCGKETDREFQGEM